MPMFEAVIVPSLTMMTSTVSEELLARDTHARTRTHTHTHTHTHSFIFVLRKKLNVRVLGVIFACLSLLPAKFYMNYFVGFSVNSLKKNVIRDCSRETLDFLFNKYVSVCMCCDRCFVPWGKY